MVDSENMNLRCPKSRKLRPHITLWRSLRVGQIGYRPFSESPKHANYHTGYCKAVVQPWLQLESSTGAKKNVFSDSRTTLSTNIVQKFLK